MSSKTCLRKFQLKPIIEVFHSPEAGPALPQQGELLLQPTGVLTVHHYEVGDGGHSALLLLQALLQLGLPGQQLAQVLPGLGGDQQQNTFSLCLGHPAPGKQGEGSSLY